VRGFRWFFLLHGQIGSPAPLARPLFTAALNAGEDVNQALGEVLRVLLSADHFGGFQHFGLAGRFRLGACLPFEQQQVSVFLSVHPCVWPQVDEFPAVLRQAHTPL